MSNLSSNMNVEISPKESKRYKSIAKLNWLDIPKFAIITGKNGSGKTQLLELLAYKISGALPPGTDPAKGLPVNVEITGENYVPHDLAYVPSSGAFSGGAPASIAGMANLKSQALQEVQQSGAYVYDINQKAKTSKTMSLLKSNGPYSIKPEELDVMLPDDYNFTISGADVTSGLTYIFLAHRVKLLEALERETPGVTKTGESLGPAPWDVLNQSLKVAGFPYEVIKPSETSLFGNYELKLLDTNLGYEIKAIDLSSGEKVLLQLVLWLYSAGQDGMFPKILLLDEPDAHLHPSMTTQFLDVISDVLVNKYNIRVILTSHSPSIVALAPEDSIFQIDRGSSQVTKVIDRQGIISVLTSGIVTVSKSTKFCFVEDVDDVNFYEAVREILSDYGPSRDQFALNTSPSMAFIAVSVGKGSSRVSGGSSIVAKWIAKLDAEPLSKTFIGILDRDQSNISRDRIFVIGRYSFENYMLDPINVFGLLLEHGTNPTISNLNITSGDEHLLRIQPQQIIQEISNVITLAMEAADPKIKTSIRTQVVYTSGIKIDVPSWVIDHRGHDLLPIAQAAFKGLNIVTPPKLIKSLRRTRMVPIEMAKLFKDIQKY